MKNPKIYGKEKEMEMEMEMEMEICDGRVRYPILDLVMVII
jgi:hypothetical protein